MAEKERPSVVHHLIHELARPSPMKPKSSKSMSFTQMVEQNAKKQKRKGKKK